VTVLAMTGVAGFAAAAAANEVNIYTYREGKLVAPLFEAFTKDTGIKVNAISASSGLEQRDKTEGANSPADVLLTADISRLEGAVQSGITQPINSKAVDETVPAQYRDPESHWAAVALRARVVYASKDRVKQVCGGFRAAAGSPAARRGLLFRHRAGLRAAERRAGARAALAAGRHR
jgi:iron(III) transport system substrate-binding protein